MSRAEAARARAAFDEMIDRRNAAKRAACPVLPLGEPVLVAVIVPAVDPLQAIHKAADARMAADPVYAATCARLDAELPLLGERSGLVPFDDGLAADGFR